MPSLGVIGSGAVGASLAELAVAAGMDVVVSNSRGPHSLTELVTTLGEPARAGTVTEAVAAGDVVVLAVPLQAVTSLPPALLAGKVVLDTSNYYPGRDGAIAELDSDQLTTSQYVQRHFAGASIVKAFNNISGLHLTAQARPRGAADRSGVPIAGDHPDAVDDAAGIVDRLGFDPVPVGDLAGSWRTEPNTPVSASAYLADPVPAGVSMAEMVTFLTTTEPAFLPAPRVRELVAGAVRGPAGGYWPPD